MRICLAEWTKQGSAWFGEFNIFRENSFEDAMTMKLKFNMKSQQSTGHVSMKSHMLNTLIALRAPESHCFL
jgi:hypothetical protein